MIKIIMSLQFKVLYIPIVYSVSIYKKRRKDLFNRIHVDKKFGEGIAFNSFI